MFAYNVSKYLLSSFFFQSVSFFAGFAVLLLLLFFFFHFSLWLFHTFLCQIKFLSARCIYLFLWMSPVLFFFFPNTLMSSMHIKWLNVSYDLEICYPIVFRKYVTEWKQYRLTIAKVNLPETCLFELLPLLRLDLPLFSIAFLMKLWFCWIFGSFSNKLLLKFTGTYHRPSYGPSIALATFIHLVSGIFRDMLVYIEEAISSPCSNAASFLFVWE